MSGVSELKTAAEQRIHSELERLVSISHRLHDSPELAYEEHRSSDLLATSLEEVGLKVERSAHGIETAFRATAGKTGPHFVICAEYDALPEIGHACGHNIIAASAVGAGFALAGIAEELQIRVTVLGTPAEESGGGKVDLINAGAFDDVDAALMVHPGPIEVVDLPTLAWSHVRATFHGKESHASFAPELGLNALDALTISYSAIGALRQHISHTQRIHGIITKGGDAPNIVPRLTEARFYVRAASMEELHPLKQRVVRCFEAGALATGCELELHWFGNDYDVVTMNPTMGSIYDRNLTGVGRTALPRAVVESQAGSTDMGNVSKVVPSIHPLMSIDSLPAVNHQADFTAKTITPAGDKAVIDAALVMAWTVIDLATDPSELAKVKSEFV